MKQNRFPSSRIRSSFMIWGAVSFLGMAGTAHAELPDVARNLLATAVASNNAATIEVISRNILGTYPEESDDLKAYLSGVGSDAATAALDALNAPPPAGPAKGTSAPVAAAAVVPPEPIPVKPTGFFGFDGWTGAVELSAALNTGNTDQKAASTAIKLKREGDKWTQNFIGSFDFTRTDGATSQKKLQIGYQLNYAVSDRSYLFGNTNFENDHFSGYNYRIIAAGGYGYKAIVQDDLTWNLEAGPGYRYSAIRDSDETDSELIGLATSDLVWKISDTAAFSNTMGVIYGASTTTFNTATAVTMAINSHLSGKLSFESKTDTDPPVGAKNTDTTTKASLVYGF